MAGFMTPSPSAVLFRSRGLWIVCGIVVFCGGWPTGSAFASCGDYLHPAAYSMTTALDHSARPVEPTPVTPRRCQGPECRSVPFIPVPTESPAPLRIFTQSAWWQSGGNCSRELPSDGGSLPADEVASFLSVRAIEHVPIV